MRKITIIILLAVFSVISAFAQSPANGVKITDVQVIPSGGNVEITFVADIDRKAVKSDNELILSPTLSKGNEHHRALPSIVVQGNRARISARRRQMSWGTDAGRGGAVMSRNGQKVNYKTSVPYEQWMEGSSVMVDGVLSGCCSENQLGSLALAQNLTIIPTPVIVEVIPEPEPVIIPQPTTGERLASTLSFVADGTDFEAFRNNPDRYIDDNREGSLIVYFKQSVKTIDFSHRDNRRTLDRLVAAIGEIQSSSDSRITRVVIAGFASPEGGTAINTRLAEGRAETVKRYLIDNSPLSGGQVEIYNGLVDWRGLRTMVEKSAMPYKQQVLGIIDNTPVWDAQRNIGRLGQLMNLGGGDPYRYMFSNFFPELRNAALIKIFYENSR